METASVASPSAVVLPITSDAETEKKMARGRKFKLTKTVSKQERNEKLRIRLLELKDDLLSEFGSVMKPPAAPQLNETPDRDPRTGGAIGKVKEPLAAYLQRVSVEGNFSQRPPFDHVMDPIYRRLIRDFIQGAAMPESKVAALTMDNQKATSLDDPRIRYSVIDGLQRLYCFGISVLLVWRREKLVEDGCIADEAWQYFAPYVEKLGSPKEATAALLQHSIRYEVFYEIDLEGLLNYMVTFNTGQRRMSLPVQLEIMQQPLINELEQGAGIPTWREMEKIPGQQKPKEKFAAQDLMLATRAFITNNPQVKAGDEAERSLEEERYLDNVGDIKDVVKVLKRIALDIHPKVMRVYADDPNKRFVLSAGGIFLTAMTAACGYVRARQNMKVLDGVIDKLEAALDRPEEDPLKLDEYAEALSMITASRGKAIRRLVYDTFLRFFTGATTELEWSDTARQIVGV